MKVIIGTALAVFLAGASAYAQEPDKDKPKDEPRKEEEARTPEPKKNERPKQEPEKHQDDRAKPAQQNDRTQEERNREQEKSQQDRVKEEERARQTQQHTDRDNHNNAHNDAHPQRGNVRRIPEEKYRVSFGREHHFHVQRRDDRRFQYGGFWFTYSDPWPGDWGYNDDVYIEEIDGEYYLFNARHPGVRIVVIVAG